MIKHETTISSIVLFLLSIGTHRTRANCEVCCGIVCAEETIGDSAPEIRVPGDVASSEWAPGQGGEIPTNRVEDQLK